MEQMNAPDAPEDDVVQNLAEVMKTLTLQKQAPRRENPFTREGVVVHANEDNLGEKIASWFSKSPEHIHAFVYAPTQSGKTGSVLRACFHTYKKLNIPPENTFVLTTLRSNEWREQTQKRFPSVMAGNIWHLNDIIKMSETQRLLWRGFRA